MRGFTRRDFLSSSAFVLATALPLAALWPPGGQQAAQAFSSNGDITGRIFRGDAPDAVWKWSTEARHYRKVKSNAVVCGLCPHHCMLLPGDRSICRSRVNVNGTLYSLAYGNPCAVNIDPVEKKPLYHFFPASRVFSIAVAGCNFRCLNCQNWEISQVKPEEVRHQELFPQQVVEAAQRSLCSAIAYTYSEPTSFFEYMSDTAALAKASDVYNLWISNGYINPGPLEHLCQLIDGANVNLKSFSDDIHKRLNGGRLQPILETFKTLHRKGVHFEITHLVVPGYVDNPDLARRMCDWIIDHLGPDHPLHFTRFFPKYKLDRLPPTPLSTLERFRDLALSAGIRYVYLGNVPGHEANHTYCHHCGRKVIERQGYHISSYHLEGNRCRYCQTLIPGRWPQQAVDTGSGSVSKPLPMPNGERADG